MKTLEIKPFANLLSSNTFRLIQNQWSQEKILQSLRSSEILLFFARELGKPNKHSGLTPDYVLNGYIMAEFSYEAILMSGIKLELVSCKSDNLTPELSLILLGKW